VTAQSQLAAKTCERCKAKFERRRFVSGRLEDAASFARRRFCSRDCYRQAGVGRPETPAPGVWIQGPHELRIAESDANASDPRRAGSSGYPWDRQRALRPVPNSGPISTERQRQLPDAGRQARS